MRLGGDAFDPIFLKSKNKLVFRNSSFIFSVDLNKDRWISEPLPEGDHPPHENFFLVPGHNEECVGVIDCWREGSHKNRLWFFDTDSLAKAPDAISFPDSNGRLRCAAKVGRHSLALGVHPDKVLVYDLSDLENAVLVGEPTQLTGNPTSILVDQNGKLLVATDGGFRPRITPELPAHDQKQFSETLADALKSFSLDLVGIVRDFVHHPNTSAFFQDPKPPKLLESEKKPFPENTL